MSNTTTKGARIRAACTSVCQRCNVWCVREDDGGLHAVHACADHLRQLHQRLHAITTADAAGNYLRASDEGASLRLEWGYTPSLEKLRRAVLHLAEQVAAQTSGLGHRGRGAGGWNLPGRLHTMIDHLAMATALLESEEGDTRNTVCLRSNDLRTAATAVADNAMAQAGA